MFPSYLAYLFARSAYKTSKLTFHTDIGTNAL
jgi:hypothetical protein